MSLPTPELSAAASRPGIFPLVVFPSARPTPPPPTGKLGTQAASFGLRTPEGQTVEFPQAANGKPTVLLFWPSWCPYSRALQPHLQSLWQDYQGVGVNVWTVNIDESGDPVAALKQRNITLPLLLEGNKVADQYGVRRTGTVKVIDGSNSVVYSTGESAASPAEIARQVRMALNALLGSRALALPGDPSGATAPTALAEQVRQPEPIPQSEWEPWIDRYLATLKPGEWVSDIALKGAVPNGKHAITVAREIWSARYGHEETLGQAPYRSYRVNGHWVVLASGTSGATAKLGEGFVAVIEVDTGRVARVARRPY